MGAGYALLALGIGLGIALTEVVRRSLSGAGKRHGVESGPGPLRAIAGHFSRTGDLPSTRWRFSARDYYDR